MRNSRHVSILVVAISILSSGVITSTQTQSKPAKPAAASPTRARAVTAPKTAVTPKSTAPKNTVAAPASTVTTPRIKDPFIGVWKLNPVKSKYESGGAPTSFTRTYEERGNGTLFMTTDVTIPQGSARSYLVYRRDGKPYPEATTDAQAIRMVSIKSINPRTEDVYLIVDGKASDTPSTISISADGMTMTQVVSGRTSKGKAFTNTIVYDKQP